MTRKTVAIMQPYLFPYIGYMNLVAASDIFIFYDDVQFIKKGWINRNRILVNAKPYTFTVPLMNPSQNTVIKATKIYDQDAFTAKFLAQLRRAYKKSLYFDRGLTYVEDVLTGPAPNIAALAARSITKFFDLLVLQKTFHTSSEISPATSSDTKPADKTERLISITKAMKSDIYINPMGGTDLYDKKDFLAHGIDLNFIDPVIQPYSQPGCLQFEPGLSIIDLVMNQNIEQLRNHIQSYQML